MDTLTFLLLCAIFLFTATLVVVIFLAWTEGRFAEKRTIKKRLLYMSAGGKHGQDKLISYRQRALKEVGAFEQAVLKLPRISGLDRMLVKSKVPMNASVFVMASCALGAIGLLLGLKFLPNVAGAVALGIILIFIPFMFLKLAERSYFNKFQEQLPEALDLLGRAMRSGHALTSGLDMIGQEMEDPIKSEFTATVDEIKLGLTVNEAFENLCARVPSTDLRFFAVAVIIQKETGGNLAEILDNISRLIRERVQFARQVKALTAEGRYSAGILIALPIVMFIYIYFANYEYVSLLWTEKIGLYMLFGAGILQLIGAYVIKKIVSIEI